MRVMQQALVLYAVLVYGLLVWSVQGGEPTPAGMCALAASPLLLLTLRVVREKGQPGKLVDLKKGSWSFQLGDTFVLTTALILCALAWQVIPRSPLFMSWQWVLGSLLLGFIAGWAFHKWDGGNYKRDGVERALNSSTKLAHDHVAYPVLLGALVCVGWPALFHWNDYSWAIVICLGIHIILMIADAIRGAKRIILPRNLHPEVDAATGELINP